MRRQTIAIAAALLGMSLQAQAIDRPAYSITEYVFSLGDSPVSTGFKFTVNQDVSVTSLGHWDYLQDGLVGTHEVGIFSITGTLLVSTLVPAGLTGALVGEYRYGTLASGYTLTAGSEYMLAAHSSAGDGYRAAEVPPATLVVDPAITISPDAGFYVYSASLSYPIGNTYDIYSTPNMLLAAPVPEASAWLLMLAGLGTVSASVRRRSA